MPGSQRTRSASGHGDFLGAGRQFGDVVWGRDVTDGNAVKRVNGGVLNTTWTNGNAAR